MGRFVRCGRRCGRLVVRRWGGVSIGSGFGRGSLGVSRARMPVWRLVCRRRLVRVGSASMAGWSHFLLSLFGGAICLLLSGKRSPFSVRRVWGCGRSVVAWVVARRRFRGSWVATPQPVAEAWSIGPRLRSGIRIGVPAVRRWRSWPPTTNFVSMCRIVWVVRSPAPMVSWCQGPRCAGSVAVMGPERIDGGQRRGVLSRSRGGSGSISPTMSR